MLKIILFLIAMFVTGFLIVHENWTVTLRGFGYEVTLSTVLLIVLVLIGIYLIQLIKKPFSWLFGFNKRRHTKHFIKKENYLTFVLKTLLDQNNHSVQQILKQKKTLLPKKDIRHLLLEAIFTPSKEVFSNLSHHKDTELAGLRGLYLEEKEKGNIKEAEKLLSRMIDKYPTVNWVVQETYEIQTLQRDWANALLTLEKLFKMKQISKNDYLNQKASLLYMQNKFKDAYLLNRTNPAFAIAYSKENPSYAKTILTTSWNKEPSWDVYLAYYELIKSLPAEKQVKAIQKLISKNKEFRISMLALADIAIKTENWRLAKETLESYLQSYPLTKNVASMMATVARCGWHHEQEAKEWEAKGLETDDKYGWTCLSCNQKTTNWSPSCPYCNKIGQIIYR